MKDSKFQILPLHHIDTSVILEKQTTDNGKYCKKYLNVVGYRYRGAISFPVLSELFFKILKLETFDEQWDTFDLIKSLIKEKKILFYSPKNIAEIDNKIKEIDSRIEPLDGQIVACAAEDEATLVTIDTKLTENSKLEKELGIEMKHPEGLV